MALCFAPVVPLVMPIGIGGLLLQYWADKFCLVRMARRPHWQEVVVYCVHIYNQHSFNIHSEGVPQVIHSGPVSELNTSRPPQVNFQNTHPLPVNF